MHSKSIVLFPTVKNHAMYTYHNFGLGSDFIHSEW